MHLVIVNVVARGARTVLYFILRLNRTNCISGLRLSDVDGIREKGKDTFLQKSALLINQRGNTICRDKDKAKRLCTLPFLKSNGYLVKE